MRLLQTVERPERFEAVAVSLHGARIPSKPHVGLPETIVRQRQQRVLPDRLRELFRGLFELLAGDELLSDAVILQRVAPILLSGQLLGCGRKHHHRQRDHDHERRPAHHAVPARGESLASHRDERGALPARRDDWEPGPPPRVVCAVGWQYREYLKGEQRHRRRGPQRGSRVGWGGDASLVECSQTFTTGWYLRNEKKGATEMAPEAYRKRAGTRRRTARPHE